MASELQLSGLADVVRQVAVAPGPLRVVVIARLRVRDAAAMDELMATQLEEDGSWSFVNRDRVKRVARALNLLSIIKAMLPDVLDDPSYGSDVLIDLEHKLRTRATYSGGSFRVHAVALCDKIRAYNDDIRAHPPVQTDEELRARVHDLIGDVADLMESTCTLRQE